MWILSRMGNLDRNVGFDPFQEDAEASVEAPVKIVACLVSRERPEDAARGRQPVGDPRLQTLQQFAPTLATRGRRIARTGRRCGPLGQRTGGS